LPAYGLVSALSTHTCSLSLKVAEACLDRITGSIHAPFEPAAAAATSSVRETAIPSNPLSAPLPGKAETRLT